MSLSHRIRRLAASAVALTLALAAVSAPAAARDPVQSGRAAAAAPAAATAALPAAEPLVATPKPAKPAAPAAPTAAKEGTTAVVTWKAPKDNGSRITGYVITSYRNGKKATTLSFDASTTSRRLTLPAAKGTWTFTVAAKNAGGVGPASRRSAAPRILARPTAPTIIAATAGVTIATLTWLPPSSDGGSPITNYVVFPYVGGVRQPSQTVGPVLTAMVSGLNANVTYTFTVAALTSQGLGPESAPTFPIQTGVSPSVTFVGGSAEVSVAYSATVQTSLGRPPYAFSITYGSLPPGLTLNAGTGTVSGVPTTAGTYAFVAQAKDSGGLLGSLLISITVVPAPHIVITSVPLAEVNASYSFRPTVLGGLAPYTWALVAGPIPPGLTFNPFTGELNGVPTTPGVYGLNLQVTDAAGLTDVQGLTVVVQAASVVALSGSSTSVFFDSPVTLTVTINPGEGQGTVTLFDRQSNGVTVNLGVQTVVLNKASFAVKLPTFGLNQLTVRYNATNTNAVVTSNEVDVQVNGRPGQLLVDQFRQSGLAGPLDQYVVLYNNTSIDMPLAGVQVQGSGVSWTVPTSAQPLSPRRGYLVAAPNLSLAAQYPSDLTVSNLGPAQNDTGIRLRVPDAANTITDAAGSLPGYSTGTALPAFTSPPTVRNAWIRLRVAGLPQDTRDNKTDFRLVATVFGPINGVPSILGTPSPLRQFGPYQQSDLLQTTLLDPSQGANAAPNQEVVSATGSTPRQLIIRRTVTNRGVTPASLVRIRITALSQTNGAPMPGSPPPANPAQLRLANPTTSTGSFVVGGRTLTVQNLSMDFPATDPPGGGLSTTLTVSLPVGGLAPGQSVNVALTFYVDQGGTFWVGWDIDALGAGPVTPPSSATALAVTAAKEQAAKKAAQQAAKSRKLTNVKGTLRH
ncbi:putative Ig domain-containing protein [Micromonospora sp. NPDC048999]|uniref:fibronectin type III domain-containing protein n=1 Tax=Micromonospora sp. NPDC048999 TaxID=3155391 RepID=UPI0034064CA7